MLFYSYSVVKSKSEYEVFYTKNKSFKSDFNLKSLIKQWEEWINNQITLLFIISTLKNEMAMDLGRHQITLTNSLLNTQLSVFVTYLIVSYSVWMYIFLLHQKEDLIFFNVYHLCLTLSFCLDVLKKQDCSLKNWLISNKYTRVHRLHAKNQPYVNFKC